MALQMTSPLAGFLPELERRVYDPLIEEKLNLSPEDGSEEQAYLRKRFAMGRFCLEATQLGEQVLTDLGISGVQPEHHVVVCGDEDLHHHFLTIPRVQQTHRDEDTVIDFTYLQFVRNWNMSIADAHPNIFLGTRAAIIELMGDPSFAEPGAERLYQRRTLAKPKQ